MKEYNTGVFNYSTVKECDRFSLVTYDSNVYLKFGLIKMTPDNKTIATTTIEAMRDGSSTNLCGGLLKGLFSVVMWLTEELHLTSRAFYNTICYYEYTCIT